MRKKDESLKLSKEEKERLSGLIKDYMDENADLDREFSNLQASLLVDFITENLGSVYYNKAVEDCIHLMLERTEDLYILMKD